MLLATLLGTKNHFLLILYVLSAALSAHITALHLACFYQRQHDISDQTVTWTVVDCHLC